MSKLDLNKPHGTIWGHASALYEQNGILYDGGGTSVEPEPPRTFGWSAKPLQTAVEAPSEIVNTEFTNDEAVVFLKTLLAGGRVAKVNIAKEAAANNISGHDLTNAATALGVVKYQQKNEEFWKLID